MGLLRRGALLLLASLVASVLPSSSLHSTSGLLQPVAASQYACGVCEAIVDEVNAGIAATTLTHHVQTRFRVDEKKRIPYARTEANLLDILEAKDFAKRFDKYAAVKPHTKSAAAVRQAYKEAKEKTEAGATGGAEQQGTEAPAAAAETPATDASVTEPAATPAAATSETTAASTDTAASNAATPSDAASAAVSAAAAAVEEVVTPPRAFVPPASAASEGVPLALLHHHVHLVPLSAAQGTALVYDHSKKVSSAIRSAVAEFLESHLDETVLLFHRDVTDIKHRLCVERTQVCKPQKRKQKKTQKKNKEGDAQADDAQTAAQAADAQTAAQEAPAEPLKTEL